MEISSRRTLTLEKIDRSINECLSLEQVTSTEQFLSLYYKQFTFNLRYLKKEWDLDNQIIKRKKQLDKIADMDDEFTIPTHTKRSLKRLEDHIKTLSKSKFEAEWAEMQSQIKDINLENTSIYGVINEKIASLKTSSRFATTNQKQLQES